MFTNERDKKLLAQRKKPAESEPDIQSYEDYKRKQDEESFLGTGIPGKYLDKINSTTEDYLDTLGSGASKVGDFFKELYYRATIPAYTKDREKVIKSKMERK